MRRTLSALTIYLLAVACGTAAPRTATTAPAAAQLPRGERRLTMSDGVELYTKVTGTGPVCLVVHGGPGQGTASFEQMGVDTLASFLTLVYVDQRGSGHSQNAANYHLDRVVQDFEEVRRTLGVDRVCLLAHSFGGILAVAYAQRHPEHVSRLILSNISLQFRSARNQRMQIEAANRLLGKSVVAVAPDADAATLAAAQERARAALSEAGQGYRLIAMNRATIAKMSEIDGSYARTIDYGMAVITKADSLPEYYLDYASQTAAIAAPVLVIAGREDFAVGPDEHTRFRFPNQRVVVLAGSHMPYFEATAEWSAAIRAFVDSRTSTR